MPLFEYHCEGCDQDVELLQKSSAEKAECPHCGSSEMVKLLSVISVGTASSSQSPSSCEPSFGCGKPQCGMGGCGLN